MTDLTKKMKDHLGKIVPEEPVLAHIRSAARKSGKSSLSLKQINREISAYRKEKK
jgi:hypothetical protein